MSSPPEEQVEKEKTKELPKKRKNKLRRRRRKSKIRVLSITCPAKGCNQVVQLLCPFCQNGALICDENFLILNCKNCHNSLHHFPCSHCEFPIKASYIKDKQSQLRHLMRNSDGRKFFAIISFIAVTSLFFWSLVKIFG